MLKIKKIARGRGGGVRGSAASRVRPQTSGILMAGHEQGRSYMVVRVGRGPPAGAYQAHRYRKFSQIGYVRPSVRGLREYALRPFCARSYFSVRPLCAPSYPLDELCFIEFDIPNDSGGGGSAAGAGRRAAAHVSHLQVYVSTSSSN